MKRASLPLIPLLLLSVGCGDDSPSKQTYPAVVKSSYTTTTADGWTIALRRYQLNLGTVYREPVLMSGGFLENGNIFDLFQKHSLAEHLALKGYDVWTYDIRGTGESQSPEVSDLFGWDYTIDHFVWFDTPAAVQFVLDATGEDQIIWVSHSLGSLMMYGYLETNDASKIKACASICGVGKLDPSQDLPGLFADLYMAFGIFVGPWLPPDMPIPLKWAIDSLLGDNIELWAIVSLLLDTPVGSLVWNHENMNPNLVYQVLKKVMSNTSTNVFKQFFEWADSGDCFSYGVTYTPPSSGNSTGGNPAYPGAPTQNNGSGSITIGENYSFTQNLWKIQTPMLVMSGESDKMVPPALAQYVYDAISSVQKKYVNCAIATGHSVDFGHMDTISGQKSREEVYPHVVEWLGQYATPR